MKIKTKRLKIRELKIKDAEAIFQMIKLPETLKFEAWGPFSQQEALSFVKEAKANRRKDDRISYRIGIRLRESKAIIGLCFLDIAQGKISTARIGYMIDPAHCGKGYATEATLGLLAFVQNELKINNVRASCDSENLASLRILEKCGFEEIGMNAELEPVKGRFRDMIQFERSSNLA